VAYRRSPPHALRSTTTNAGPAPLPMSSVKVNIAKAVPRTSGELTFYQHRGHHTAQLSEDADTCKTDRTLGPLMFAKKPATAAMV
jgi:hypothetical protein